GEESKAPLARRHGCHQVLVGYHELAARTRALNRGKGVDVVYDGVGRDTFHGSLDALRARGMMVTFGNASGAVEPFTAADLQRRGSLYVTRPTAADYLNTAAARTLGARELFALMKRRVIRVHIGKRHALADAAQAQQELESRRTVGATVLLP
ncbi:MAG: zinc-binding dehydrogenase, partial [Rhodanobacteraceae bacterium]